MFGRHFELYLNSGAICVCWMESKTISIVSCANRFRSFSTRLDCSCKFAKKKKKEKKKCESKRKRRKTAPSSPSWLIIMPAIPSKPLQHRRQMARMQKPAGVFPAFTISLIASAFISLFGHFSCPLTISCFLSICLPGAPEMSFGWTSVMHCIHNFYFALELYYLQAALIQFYATDRR